MAPLHLQNTNRTNSRSPRLRSGPSASVLMRNAVLPPPSLPRPAGRGGRLDEPLSVSSLPVKEGGQVGETVYRYRSTPPQAGGSSRRAPELVRVWRQQSTATKRERRTTHGRVWTIIRATDTRRSNTSGASFECAGEQDDRNGLGRNDLPPGSARRSNLPQAMGVVDLHAHNVGHLLSSRRSGTDRASRGRHAQLPSFEEYMATYDPVLRLPNHGRGMITTRYTNPIRLYSENHRGMAASRADLSLPLDLPAIPPLPPFTRASAQEAARLMQPFEDPLENCNCPLHALYVPGHSGLPTRVHLRRHSQDVILPPLSFSMRDMVRRSGLARRGEWNGNAMSSLAPNTLGSAEPWGDRLHARLNNLFRVAEDVVRSDVDGSARLVAEEMLSLDRVWPFVGRMESDRWSQRERGRHADPRSSALMD